MTGSLETRIEGIRTLVSRHQANYLIIPLSGISLSDSASRTPAEWFHILEKTLCDRNQFSACMGGLGTSPGGLTHSIIPPFFATVPFAKNNLSEFH